MVDDETAQAKPSDRLENQIGPPGPNRLPGSQRRRQLHQQPKPWIGAR